MALVLNDRVLETCTSPGVGSVSLLGAATGYQTFAVGVGNTNTCYYTIADQSGPNWEVGIGTYSSGGNTLARTTVLSSSNAGSLTNFSTGAQNVFVSYPAEKALYLDANNNAIISGQIIQGTSTGAVNGSLQLRRNITGGATAYSTGISATVQSDVTGQASGYNTFINTAAASFTLNLLKHYNAQQGTIGAASAVTNQYGFFADSALTGATNNYGFYSNIASGTGRFNFYAAGTAVNCFAGDVGIGTAAPSAELDIGSTASGGTFASQIFSANNSAAAKTNYVKIDALVALNSAGFEAGGYQLKVLQNNAYKTIIDASGTLYNSTNYLAFGTTNEAIRIVSNGTTSIGGIPGAESLRVTPVASAVNYVNVSGAVTTGAPVISAQGSDTNIGITLTPKGTGVVSTTASVGIGTTTPIGPLEVTGTTASMFVRATDVTQASYVVAAASDYPTSFRAAQLIHYNASATGTTLGFSNANLGVLSFLNSTQVAILATGSSALRIGTFGATAINISASQTIALGGIPGAESLRVVPVVSAVNFLRVQSAIATASPELAVAGSDTNIDLALTTKGTGVLSFGTYTAGVVTQAGYITIKDAGGTTRRLLVG